MDTDKKLTINEIFFSIQGESYLAGLPCVFIRTTGCHQRCVYCDTEYAFYEGKKMTLAEILAAIQAYPCKNVLLTGGEPLLQENIGVLAQILLDQGYTVATETGGNLDVRKVPKAVIKVMDLKTPSSGELERNTYENLAHLDPKDEVKIVVMNETDLDWALNQIRERDLTKLCHVSLSPTDRSLLPLMADRILSSGLPIRLQTQFHKVIWPDRDRGY